MSRRARKPSGRKPIVESAAPARLASPWIGWTACVAVAIAAFALSFHKIDNFDTWWHLAAGRWIATHHAIPATDTLSFTVPDHPWINLQWGFDLVVYLLQRLGGIALLNVFGALLVVLTTVVLIYVISRAVGSSVAALI